MRPEDLTARQMLYSGVTVRHITTSDLFCLHPEDDVGLAVRELESLDLDQAPLADSSIQRCVFLKDLRGRSGQVAAAASPIGVDQVVAGSTGLADLLPRFATSDHFYVLGGDGIEGIVTRADLQLPPVSMAVFGIIISLEMALTPLIASYSHGSWLDLLQAGRKEKLLDRFGRAQRSNAEITQLECLDLVDRFDLIGRMPELGQALELPSRKMAAKLRKRVEKLRNPLAHGSSLIAAHSDFEQVLGIIGEVQELGDRAWSLVGESPLLWDAYVATEIAPVDPIRASLTNADCGAVHIITAHNPNSTVVSERANDQANERLRAYLDPIVESMEEVVCYSLSGEWSERSFAVVGLHRDEVLQAARRFRQRAIFEIQRETLRVICCETGSVKRERRWPIH